MPYRCSSRLLALALALPCWVWTSAHAGSDADPMARWRAQIDQARRLAAPPPPKGVRDLPWNELSPPGWNPGKILQRLGVTKVDESEPRARELEAEIQREWDDAPTVAALDHVPARMTGYPIMLGEGQGLAHTIILVPYYGSGIHRPPAPANQMVMVSLKRGLPRNMVEAPIWVTGTIIALSTPTLNGRAGYTMIDATWQKYPAEKYPLPPYIPLR